MVYYQELARVSQLPTFIYHIPHLTHHELDVSALIELLQIEGVVGLKFTDWNLFLMRRVLYRLPETIVFNGFDEFLLPTLRYGAKGGGHRFLVQCCSTSICSHLQCLPRGRYGFCLAVAGSDSETGRYRLDLRDKGNSYFSTEAERCCRTRFPPTLRSV